MPGYRSELATSMMDDDMSNQNYNNADDNEPILEVDNPVSLHKMVIGSVDTLRGIKIDQRVPPEWNCEPPLLIKVPKPTKTSSTSRILQPFRQTSKRQLSDDNYDNDLIYGTAEEQERLLKGMIRLGIPAPLRCAVWLSNIIQSVQPQQPLSYWLEYRTLAKIRALDTAYEYVLQQIVMPPTSSSQDSIEIISSPTTNHHHDNDDNIHHPDDQQLLSLSSFSWDVMDVPLFGRDEPGVVLDGMTPSGQLAYKRVLICLERITGIDYAPMVPSITTIYLTIMSESYTFCAIREMAHQSTGWYFPISRTEHVAWCYAFGDILRKLHNATALYLEDRGVLDVNGLHPIFCDCFLSILPLPCVQRIMDIYTFEGSKVLFRFGVALLVLYRIESAERLITISNADEWWNTLKIWAYSKHFHFDLLVRKAYGVHGRGIRRQMHFPRRRIIQRIIRLEEENIRANRNHDDKSSDVEQTYSNDENELHSIQPLGLVQNREVQSYNDFSKNSYHHERIIPKPIFAELHQVRYQLAKWLPITLRQTNLQLLYSTNTDGRTLERFYTHVGHSKHTILICEVLPSNNNPYDTNKYVIGMYASQAWRVSSKVYGDGSVFLFRLQPNAICWKWKPDIVHELELDDDNNEHNNQTALLEQFMVSTNSFISMGGNTDGSSGLRINEDLTKGESSTACGYHNEPLHGLNHGSVFDIGLLEVYGFVRQIDGRAL